MFSQDQYRALREGCGLVDRSDRGRVRLTGQDRRDYLQGLLTNDIAALSPGTGCYACLLTAQGRMIADMYVVETGDEILLDVEGKCAPRVTAHLEQFIFSEDVQVAEQSGSLAQIGVFGPSAPTIVSHVLGASDASTSIDRLQRMKPLENRSAIWAESSVLIVARDDLGVPGFDLLIDRTGANQLADALRAAGAIDVDAAVADVCRVEAGRPVFYKDMDEETIPLEAGIEDRAISLTKGCYVGQEIIIRVLHRGHGRVARRLVGLTLDSGARVPQHGDSIRFGERDIGRITSAVFSPALGRPIALGYVHRDFTSPGTEVTAVADAAGQPAVVTKLPFVETGVSAAAATRPPDLARHPSS
jgi:folate-binding protein YgfZ